MKSTAGSDMRLGKAGLPQWMAASMAESLAPTAEKGALCSRQGNSIHVQYMRYHTDTQYGQIMVDKQ